MTGKKLSLTSRVLVAFASGALICAFFLPVWRIDLFAPQYPEGLTMNIWINGLSGDVDVINGLNHYIGMKPISESMFPEFKILPFVVGFFLLFGITVAITGSLRLLFFYLLLSVLGGIVAMADFYKWGYDYGHQLDPRAPIQVPGLSYQPPLFGYRQLLNFEAWSLPHVGGWVVVGAGILAFLVWLLEWWSERKSLRMRPRTLIVLILPLLLASCQTGPSAWVIGRYACDHCKMTITDDRFGASLLTTKGVERRFDDLACLISYQSKAEQNSSGIDKVWVISFAKPGEFVEASNAVYIIDPALKSPMASHAAAFENAGQAKAALPAGEVKALSWEILKATLR
ncbi:MAG: nitrous oxide reductase accessory protein NosL [Chitinophagaceae bacterium]